jgi:predicted AAA+ superfamily ATPase
MRRVILTTLKDWRTQKNRKVLLLRGARQVGKTYIVRKLAKEFNYYVEVNFEKNPDIQQFFEQNLDPVGICTNLSAYYGIPIIDGETLLFFDEIQSSPKAIQSLRFFYESMPELHVIAAGSLLEFALEDLTSWGVGRIRSVYMYPMSFDEFLMACNQNTLIDLKKKATPENPLIPAFHEKLKDYLKTFLMIGGMPEVVKTFIGNSSDMNMVQKVLSDIAISYNDDFAKYKSRAPVLRLRETMGSVVKQSGGKYIYSQSGSLSNPAQAKEALDLLEMAGLVYKVYHSSGQGIPMGTEANYKMFKILLHDNGIFQQIAGLRLSDLLIAKNVDMLNKGNIAEIFAGVEMIKYSNVYEKRQLYYWHREKRGSCAEVDYLIEHEGQVVPVEVKSGSSGKMQSLNLFMEEKKSSKGIRISLENFSQYGKITVIPLYAISNLFQNDGGLSRTVL